MRADESVFVYGIGVPDHKGAFGTTLGLEEEFGKKRCLDTPLAEAGMTGFGIGAALAGLRPVHVHLRADFLLLAMDQLVNMAASHHYVTTVPVPYVVRAVVGRGWGQGCHHSKPLGGMLSGVPGLKVVAPVTPEQAKGLLMAAVMGNNPTVILEHRWLYWAEGVVPEGLYRLPIGKDERVRQGQDLTVVASSWMVVEALLAAKVLAGIGISVEVVDAVTLNPYNGDAAIQSVKKTGRCIVADNDWLGGGWGAEAAALIGSRCFVELKLPVVRVGWAKAHCPTERKLENKFYANARDIVEMACLMFDVGVPVLREEELFSHERRFKGPF